MHWTKYRDAPLACSALLALALSACSGKPEFTARIFGPEIIGPCDDLIVDAALPQTIGDQTFAWSVTPSSPALLELLDRVNGPRLQIPSRLLAANAQYEVGLVATVNKAPAGPGQLTVTRQALETLVVALDGPSSVTIDGTQSLVITGKATLPRCDALDVDYEWVQTAGPTAPILEAYKRRNIIHFSPGDLTPGQDYAFEMRATVNTNPVLTGTAVQNISVARLSPIALIAGGNRSVGACQTIAIDARLSSSPDRRPLSFTWQCQNINGAMSTDCNIDLPDEAVLAIGPGLLAAGIHRLTVNVSDGERQTAASIDVNVACDVSTPPTTSLSLASGARVDPASALIIEASVTDTSACGGDVTWEITGGSVNLSSLAVGGDVFAIPANALTAGDSYNVKAHAQNCAGFTEKTTTFTANTPPASGGPPTVTPTSGNAYETLFELSAPAYTDIDGGVMYQYFYIDEAHSNALVALGGPQVSPTLRTTLPQGFPSNLQLRLVVTDALGVRTTPATVGPVTVINPDKVLFSELTSKFRTLLAAHQTAINSANVILARGLYGSDARSLVSNTTAAPVLAAVYLNVTGASALRSGTSLSNGCTVNLITGSDYFGVFELAPGEMLSIDPTASLTGFVELVLIPQSTFDLPIASERAFFHNTQSTGVHSFNTQFLGSVGSSVDLFNNCSVAASDVSCPTPYATLTPNQSVSGPAVAVNAGDFIVASPLMMANALHFTFPAMSDCSSYLFAPLP